MQQLMFVEKGRIERWDVDAPQIDDPRQAIVRPVAVATCDLDSAIVRGLTPWAGPLPVGHEGVAEVLVIGDDVADHRVGDLVCLPYQVSCGTCCRCVAGLTAHCDQHGGAVAGPQFYGWSPTARQWGGFLSDQVLVPFADHMLLKLPPGIEPSEVASLSDNIVDGWRSVAAPLLSDPGASVLIVGGSGAIGLYAVDAAVGLGASHVRYVDRDPNRLQKAQRLGAEAIAVDRIWPKSLPPASITVDANSTPAGLLLALRSTDHGGTCTSTGMYFQPLQLPLYEFYLQNITLRTGLIQARPGMTEALALIETNRLRPSLITDRLIPWDQAADALADVRTKLVFHRSRET